MTDNEIIKALERMSAEDSNGFSSDILNLINRQKAEIERLKAENEGYKHLDTILRTAIDELTANIKSEVIREFAVALIGKINELDVYSCDIGYGNTDRGYLASETISIITALVKEMTEGGNDKQET